MKASSLINTVFRLFPYIVNHDTLGGIGELIRAGNESDHEPQLEDESGMITAKDYELLTLKKKLGAVIIILGTRGTGKTNLAYRLAKFIGKPIYAISPEEVPPSWVTRVTLDNFQELVPPNSTLVMDDLPVYMGSHDYHEALIQVIEKIIPMVRHERHWHLIFSSQSSIAADRHILDCDLAFLKPLGLLIGAEERPSIARLYRNFVDPAFLGRSDRYVLSHAFMMSRTFQGMVLVKKVNYSSMSD